MSELKILLFLNTILVISLIGLVFLLARYIGDFIKKIQSISGIQIGSLISGDFAPNFREFDQNGNKIISSQLYKSEKTLLLFIKSTCPVCKSILQELKKVQESYKLNYVIINIDEITDDSYVLQILKDNFIYIKSNRLSQLFSITSVPHAILVNTEGKIESAVSLKDKKSLWNLLINENTLVV